MPNVRFFRPDHLAVDLPAESVGAVIGVAANPPENNPEAKTLLFYDIGMGLFVEALSADVDEVHKRVLAASGPMRQPWIKLTGRDGDFSYLQPHSIIHRTGVNPEEAKDMNTLTHFRPVPGHEPKFIFSLETMEEIDALILKAQQDHLESLQPRSPAERAARAARKPAAPRR